MFETEAVIHIPPWLFVIIVKTAKWRSMIIDESNENPCWLVSKSTRSDAKLPLNSFSMFNEKCKETHFCTENHLNCQRIRSYFHNIVKGHKTYEMFVT